MYWTSKGLLCSPPAQTSLLSQLAAHGQYDTGRSLSCPVHITGHRSLSEVLYGEREGIFSFLLIPVYIIIYLSAQTVCRADPGGGGGGVRTLPSNIFGGSLNHHSKKRCRMHAREWTVLYYLLLTRTHSSLLIIDLHPR